MKEKKSKKAKLSLAKLSLIILLIIVFISGIFFIVDIVKNNKMTGNKKNEISVETKERINKIKKKVEDREKTINEINSGKMNIEDYKYLDVVDFMNHLKKEQLFKISENDEIIGNVIRIKGEKIELNDYKKEDGKAVRTTEGNIVASGKPVIIFTDKIVTDKDGNVVIKAEKDGKVKFDGLKIGSDSIVVVLDKEERSLTHKLKVEFSKPVEEWKVSQVYEVKYSVTDKDGNTDEKKIKVKVIKL